MIQDFFESDSQKMLKIFGNTLLLVSFTQIVFAMRFCEDQQKLSGIFTLGSVTYARKGDNFYRTFVGQPFGIDGTQGIYYLASGLFNSTSN